MKIAKLLLIVFLFIFVISCCKEDTHSLDNTRWISRIYQNSDQSYALTFSNGYVNRLRLDPQTHQVRYVDFTAKYSFKRDKLTIYIELADKIIPFEGERREGVIYLGEFEYYLD